MTFYISGNEKDLKNLIKVLKKTRKEMKVISKSNDNHEVTVNLKENSIGHLSIDGTEIKYDKNFEIK